MALLEAQDLCVDYLHEGRRVRAVDQVSFAIEAGEVLALVGESGSGKSSIALALGRLLPPSAIITGRVAIDGRDVLALPAEAVRRLRGKTIAYVFQEPATSLNPVLTIGEQLMETLALHQQQDGAAAREAAIDWLTRVGFRAPAERLAAYPHELSGGMQQRAMLAMALAAGPSLLVADEPTTALDVTVQVQILRLLRDLQRTLGLAVLLISHDLMVVERLAHRVGILSAGRLVELGPVAQVLSAPRHDATKALLACRAMLALRRSKTQGDAGSGA